MFMESLVNAIKGLILAEELLLVKGLPKESHLFNQSCPLPASKLGSEELFSHGRDINNKN